MAVVSGDAACEAATHFLETAPASQSDGADRGVCVCFQFSIIMIYIEYLLYMLFMVFSGLSSFFGFMQYFEYG